MAQVETELQMAIGTENGSLNRCQRCGGKLSEPVDGTDPDRCEDIGGFEESYRCLSCNKTGTYKYRYADGKQSYSGVCADYDQ